MARAAKSRPILAVPARCEVFQRFNSYTAVSCRVQVLNGSVPVCFTRVNFASTYRRFSLEIASYVDRHTFS